MAQDRSIAQVIEQIEAEHGVEVEVTGGGKGWKASADGGETYKGTSKIEALLALETALNDGMASVDEAEEDAEIADIEEIEGCAEECQSSESDFCQCKCGGQNHGALVGRKAPAVQIGKKYCKCGCGETTNRTFVPGHDARYHGLQVLFAWAKEQGLTGTEEELRKARAAAVRKVARERRAQQRAEAAAKAEAVAAKIK